MSDPIRLEPPAAFRLDLTAWALRRRSHNSVDRWDAGTYERVVCLDSGPVALSVTQAAGEPVSLRTPDGDVWVT